MDFPVGSLAVLILFILITSNFIEIEEHRYRILVLGLAGVLLGSFLVIPLPSPKGMQVSLNTGHTLIPALISLMLWLEAPVEDKYRSSLGTAAVGLTLYGFAALIDLEPGIIRYPLIFSVPIVMSIALLTARTTLAGTLAIVSGCTLVVLIRYFESIFSLQAGTFFELPGKLVWNTMSLSAVGILIFNWGIERAKDFTRGRIFPVTEQQSRKGSMLSEDTDLLNEIPEQEQEKLIPSDN